MFYSCIIVKLPSPASQTNDSHSACLLHDRSICCLIPLDCACIHHREPNVKKEAETLKANQATAESRTPYCNRFKLSDASILFETLIKNYRSVVHCVM